MLALEVAEPWGLDQLKFVQRPDPRPGPGEVLVRMKAASLNYRDLMMVSGRYPGVRAPVTPLSDGCGVIEAVGEGVTRFAPGDRVASLFFQSWISGRVTTERISRPLGSPVPGVARELAVYSQEGLSKVPDFLTDEEVATLPCAGLTAWRALFEDASLAPGDMVVLQGTGGVSIFGLQFAHAAGLRTLITSSSDAKLERAAALGADHRVNYRTTPDWAAPVRAATAGRGADFIMEVGGAGTMPTSIRAVATGGHIAVIGMVSAAGEGFNPTVLIQTSARLQGLMVGSRDMFEAMCRSIALSRLTPVVDKVFPWTEARTAFEAMRDGEHFGKIVLKF
jgi:NADPH:quinone reductase-like Zn-dependent oxidoreductase